MAASGGRRKKGKGKPRPRKGHDPALLIRAIDHEVRRKVLRALHEAGEPRSPVMISKEVGVVLGTVSYHFNLLRVLGAVKQVSQKQKRGAMEHFLVSTIADHEAILALLEETRQGDEAKKPPKR